MRFRWYTDAAYALEVRSDRLWYRWCPDDQVSFWFDHVTSWTYRLRKWCERHDRYVIERRGSRPTTEHRLPGGGRVTIIYRRSALRRPWTLALTQAESGGGPVLKTEASWRKVNGAAVFLPDRAVWIELRRVWRRHGVDG